MDINNFLEINCSVNLNTTMFLFLLWKTTAVYRQFVTCCLLNILRPVKCKIVSTASTYQHLALQNLLLIAEITMASKQLRQQNYHGTLKIANDTHNKDIRSGIVERQ